MYTYIYTKFRRGASAWAQRNQKLQISQNRPNGSQAAEADAVPSPNAPKTAEADALRPPDAPKTAASDAALPPK